MMKNARLSRILAGTAAASCALFAVASTSTAADKRSAPTPAKLTKLTLLDPAGDDNGPGKYVYPTDPTYTPKSFDLRKVEMVDKGKTIEFSITVGARIKDPWNSKDWDGNGFSLQFAQIYIDTNGVAGKGHTKPLPGLGAVEFAPAQAWDKLVLISPQGKLRLTSEVKYKAKDMRNDVVIPRKTKARGKTLVAIVKKSDLGQPMTHWGFQVVMQSNEGYPDKTDVLTRRVNEIRGQHRFGGGHDSTCDPHVIDMLAGKAKGADDEIKAQHSALQYVCGKKSATLPMIYAAAK